MRNLGLVRTFFTSLLVFLFVLTNSLSCQRSIPIDDAHRLGNGIGYRLDDSTESLAWAIELLTYKPLTDIQLPVEVPVTFEQCDGDVNAYYFSGGHKISICYPLLSYFDSIMERDAAKSAMMWVLAHELGHAVPDFLNIPVIRGEDVADSFAVWFSTVEQSMAAMMWFSDRSDGGEHNPQDPHSSAEVRLANVQCWLYGRTELTTFWISPWTRDCAGEWEAIDKFWRKALGLPWEPSLAAPASLSLPPQ